MKLQPGAEAALPDAEECGSRSRSFRNESDSCQSLHGIGIYIEVKITSLTLLFLPPSALCLVSVFQEYMEREIREQDTALWIFDEYDTWYADASVIVFLWCRMLCLPGLRTHGRSSLANPKSSCRKF